MLQLAALAAEPQAYHNQSDLCSPTDGGVGGHSAAAPEAAPVEPVEAGLVAAVEAAVGDGLPEDT